MAAEAIFEYISGWILGVLAVYALVIMAVGLYFSRYIKECDDHVVAGRDLPLIYMIGSVTATWLCAGAILGAAGYAYLYGMQGTIYDPWAPALTLVLTGLFFAYRMRTAGYTSIVDFYDTRYDRRMSILFMIIQVIGTMAWIAAQMVALGIIVHLTTGFDFAISIVLSTIAIIVITYSGGLKALARVDTVNVVLIAVGLVILFPVVINALGGWSEFVANAEVYDWNPPFAMVPVPGPQGFLWYVGFFGIVSYIAAWLGVGLGDLSCAILMQRALAARTAKTAAGGFIMGGLLYLGIALIPVFIGIATYTYGLSLSPDNAEFALTWAVQYFMPDWFAVYFIVIIAGAILSTAGDSVLINATMIGHNIYRYFKPGATSVETLKMVRIAVPLTGLLCMLIAIYFETVYRLIVFAGCIGLPTIVPAFVFGLFWKKANTRGAVFSFFAGLATWIIGFAAALPHTVEANMDMLVEGEPWWEEAIWDALFFATIPAAVVCVLILIVVSLKTQKSDPPNKMLTADGETMEDKPLFFWSKQKGLKQ